MERKIESATYRPETNTTIVYYSNNEFDTFPGNVVAEKAGVVEKPAKKTATETVKDAVKKVT